MKDFGELMVVKRTNPSAPGKFPRLARFTASSKLFSWQWKLALKVREEYEAAGYKTQMWRYNAVSHSIVSSCAENIWGEEQKFDTNYDTQVEIEKQ